MGGLRPDPLPNKIRGRQIKGYKFRRQAPIGKFIVDFVCHEKRLIIELDGGQHRRQEKYDHYRSEYLRACGYDLIRFWNNDVLMNMDAVLEVIHRQLTPHPGLPPQGVKGRCSDR
ncbi:MAG: endonuclease domain-containing protein [Desulfobacterales bacterium]